MEQRVIVAVDFDGVLCKNEFPEIGRTNYEVVSFVRRMQDAGVETILWTSRVGDRLAEAVYWCKDNGLHFSAVNANAPSNLEEYGSDPRKVFAHFYMDDQTPHFQWCVKHRGYENALEECVTTLRELLIKKGVKL